MLLCYAIPETGIDACGLHRGSQSGHADLPSRTTGWTSRVSCPLCLKCIALMYV